MAKIIFHTIILLTINLILNHPLFSKDKLPPLRIPFFGKVITLNPTQYHDFHSLFIANQIYDSLLARSATDQVRPAIAEMKGVESNGRKYVFEIIEGRKFSDGSLITTHDVLFSFEFLVKHKKNNINVLEEIVGAKDYKKNKTPHIKGIEVIDSKVFSILLERPNHFFLYAMSMPTNPILPSAYKKAIDQGRFFNQPIGSGPFQIKQIDDKGIELVPNSFYYETVPVRKLEIVYLPRQFLNPENPFDLAKYSLIFPVRDHFKKKAEGFKSYYFSEPQVLFLGVNSKCGPWRKRENRKILFESIPVEEIRSQILPGWRPASDYIPEGLLGHNPLLPPYDYQPLVHETQLKSILSQAGCNHLRFYVYYLSPDPLREILKKGMGSAVDHLSIETIPYQQFLINGRSEMSINGFIPNYPDAFEFLEYFRSDFPLNFFGFSNPDYDDLLKKSQGVADKVEKAKFYQQLSKMIYDDYLVLPFGYLLDREVLVAKPFLFKDLGLIPLMEVKLHRVVMNKE